MGFYLIVDCVLLLEGSTEEFGEGFRSINECGYSERGVWGGFVLIRECGYSRERREKEREE